MSGAGAGAREGAQIGGILLSLDPDSAEPPFRQLKAQIVTAIRSGRLGESAAGLTRLGVRLSESHIAWAGYEADL